MALREASFEERSSASRFLVGAFLAARGEVLEVLGERSACFPPEASVAVVASDASTG